MAHIDVLRPGTELRYRIGGLRDEELIAALFQEKPIPLNHDNVDEARSAIAKIRELASKQPN